MNYINEVDVGDVFKDARKNIEYVVVGKNNRQVKFAEKSYYDEVEANGSIVYTNNKKTLILSFGDIDDCVYAEYSLNLSLNIFKGVDLVVARDLKCHDAVRNFQGRKYIVVENHVDDVLYLVEDTMNDSTTNELNGNHLFYGDIEDVVYAKDVFNIDLKGNEND